MRASSGASGAAGAAWVKVAAWSEADGCGETGGHAACTGVPTGDGAEKTAAPPDLVSCATPPPPPETDVALGSPAPRSPGTCDFVGALSRAGSGMLGMPAVGVKADVRGCASG